MDGLQQNLNNLFSG